MSNTQTPNPGIPLITENTNYPIPLTDRFGDFLKEDNLKDFWLQTISHEQPDLASRILASHEGLSRQYNTPTGNLDLKTGDPRQFMSEEMAFVAYHEGRIGIHTEFELDLTGTPEALAEVIQHWQAALEPLRAIYNHSRFFLAMGDMTYKHRLTLNAFTPLNNGRIGNVKLAEPERYLMVSPYHVQEKVPSIEACPMLEELPLTLIEMGMYDHSAIPAVTAARDHIRKRAAA